MALPFPSVPVLNDNIATSIAGIAANIAALDGFLSTNFKVLSETRDMTAATGAVSYTGVGFQPTAIICVATDSVLSSSWGICDSTPDERCNYKDYDGDLNRSTTDFVGLVQSAAVLQSAVVNSLDSDGFTLGWTKGGTPTGTANLVFICIL